MFLKEILREIRLTLVQVIDKRESRYWGLLFLAMYAIWVWH